MKHTILMTLLGLTVAVLTPSLAVADNGDRKWRSNNNHDRGYIRSQVEHKREIGKVKPPKRHHDKVVKHQVKKQHNVRKHHDPKTSFSITFGSALPGLVYGNNYPERYVYKDYRVNKRGNIYKRMDRQSRRIQQGVNSGQLVRHEARTLREEQDRISWKVSKFNRDGRLDRHERSKLNHLLDVADNNIRNLKHNRLTRDSRRHRNNDNYAWR